LRAKIAFLYESKNALRVQHLNLMKGDPANVISELKKVNGARCLLLFGDDLRVQETCRTVINFLVPEEARGFNLERFDGRVTPWERVQAALMTPPLLPGTKVVWIETAPYFITREQRGELGERVLQLWTDGKHEEASKLLIDLLVVEGWSQQEWERLVPGAPRELAKLLNAETEEEVEKLLAYCKNQKVDLNGRRSVESHGLEQILQEGLPPWAFLLLSAVQVDRRMRLYKRLDELRAVFHLALERERDGKLSRETLLEFIDQQMRDAGKTAEIQVRESIMRRSASDLRGLKQELEKLFLYAGERSALRAQDVADIVTDNGAGWVFDLTRAIGERNANAALSQLVRLIAAGEHPLKLLGALASEARRLLAARQLLDGELRGRWRSGMSYPQFQQRVLASGVAHQLTRNSYADYMCLLRAERLSMPELCSFMKAIHDADSRLKSSANQPRLIMERLVLTICLGQRTTPARGRRP
jgi:DNA polymerase III subunit delta